MSQEGGGRDVKGQREVLKYVTIKFYQKEFKDVENSVVPDTFLTGYLDKQ